MNNNNIVRVKSSIVKNGEIEFYVCRERTFSVGYSREEHERLVERFRLESKSYFNKERFSFIFKEEDPVPSSHKRGAYDGYSTKTSVWFSADMADGHRFLSFEIPVRIDSRTGKVKLNESYLKDNWFLEKIHHLDASQKETLLKEIKNAWINAGGTVLS